MVEVTTRDGPEAPTLGLAFPGLTGLDDDTNAALAKALADCGYAPADGAGLADVRLTGIGHASIRRDLRLALEAVLRQTARPLGPASCRLGDLVPARAELLDALLPASACGPRLAAMLRRNGCSRWSELLDRTLAELDEWHGVGPAGLAELVGMCFEQSLAGLAVDDVHPA
ncbi:MAG: hypothetical protein ACRD12_05830, partial [Acidimicrobiales bacterium]